MLIKIVVGIVKLVYERIQWILKNRKEKMMSKRDWGELFVKTGVPFEQWEE